MSQQPRNSLFSALRVDAGHLVGEMREMLAARWQLLKLELRQTAVQLRRLVLVGLLVALLLLSGWPLLVGALVDMLDGWAGLSRTAWAAILGGSLVILSIVTALVGWRRWRGALDGLEASLEELQEDITWLREWTGEVDRAGKDAATIMRAAAEHDVDERQ